MRAALFMGWVALALGGCASQSFSMRGLPPETPAADNAAAIKAAAVLAAAQTDASQRALNQEGAQHGAAANGGRCAVYVYL
jgi:hypothetical protein